MSVLALAFALAGAAACAPAYQAYIEWRPGLSAADFDGTFELSLDEYEAFDTEGRGYLRFDRRRGKSTPDAAATMAALAQAIAEQGPADLQGHGVMAIESDGRVVLRDGQGSYSGSIDWLAVSEDGRHAALVSGTKLSVIVDGVTAGVEAGALLGPEIGAHHLVLSVSEGELSVFALPEIGGSITAFEPGFLFSFRYQPGARERWDITVARVAVAM